MPRQGGGLGGGEVVGQGGHRAQGTCCRMCVGACAWDVGREGGSGGGGEGEVACGTTCACTVDKRGGTHSTYACVYGMCMYTIAADMVVELACGNLHTRTHARACTHTHTPLCRAGGSNHGAGLMAAWSSIPTFQMHTRHHGAQVCIFLHACTLSSPSCAFYKKCLSLSLTHHTHTCAHAHTHARAHTHAHTHAHTQSHTHIHTHTHLQVALIMELADGNLAERIHTPHHKPMDVLELLQVCVWVRVCSHSPFSVYTFSH